MKKQRLSFLITLLSSSGESGLTLTDIFDKTKDRFNVSRKTIERDIHELSISYPIIELSSYPARFAFPSDYRVSHAFNLSEEDIQTVLLSLSSLQTTGPDGLKSLAIQAENSLIKALPASLQVFSARQRELQKTFISFEGRSIGTSTETMRSILESLRKNKYIQITYNSPYKKRRAKQRIFAPLCLELSGGVPYLIAKEKDDNKNKKLRLNRISQISILEYHSGTASLNFSRSSHLSAGGVTVDSSDIVAVEIIGTEQLATYFREFEVSEGQTVKPMQSGLFLIQLNIPMVPSVLRLLLSLLPEIYDIKPSKFKRELKAMINACHLK